jgi:protein required for attachment to host cells
MKTNSGTTDYCVVAADAAEARFFTLMPAVNPTIESGPKLLEVTRLRNSEKELPEGDMFRSSRRGGRNPAGQSLAYEDHRGRHEVLFAERFAQKVGETATRLGKAHHTHVLVLAAEPRMLGLLRHGLGHASREGLEIREFNGDVTKMAPSEIQTRLAHRNLMPPCATHAPPLKRATVWPW